MKIDIINFAKEEGKKISDSILSKEVEYPYLLVKAKKPIKGFAADMKKGFFEGRETEKMEKEISDRALHEATAFFMKNGEIKFDLEIKEELIRHLSQSSKNPSVLKKLTLEQLLASEIQNFVVDFLLQNEVFVFQNNV